MSSRIHEADATQPAPVGPTLSVAVREKEARREGAARAPIRCPGMRIRLQPGQRVRAPRYLGGELHDAVYVGGAPPLVGGPYVGGGQPAPVIRVRVRFPDGEELALRLDAVEPVD